MAPLFQEFIESPLNLIQCGILIFDARLQLRELVLHLHFFYAVLIDLALKLFDHLIQKFYFPGVRLAPF